jgi:hypothetical protein
MAAIRVAAVAHNIFKRIKVASRIPRTEERDHLSQTCHRA